jgi:hypothetical protein
MKKTNKLKYILLTITTFFILAFVATIPVRAASELPAAQGGTIRLTEDVQLSTTWGVTSSVTLDLNGHGLIGSGDDRVIAVANGCTLTITDSRPSTQHKYNVDANGLAVVGTTGIKSFTGGYITGGSAVGSGVELYNDGGGVYVEEGGTLTMRGGTILGNTANNHGGGIFIDEGGTFNMNGGAILGNTAAYKGGGVTVFGTINMSGGVISNNTSDDWGAGVWFDGTEFTMQGAPVVSGNVCGTIDDNVHLAENCEIIVTGALTGDAGSIGVRRADVYGLTARCISANYQISASDVTKFKSDNAECDVVRISTQVYIGKLLTEDMVSIDGTEYTYTGRAITPSVTVMDGDKNLSSYIFPQFYYVNYYNNTSAGTATVTVSGNPAQGYCGSVTKEFTINKVPLTVRVRNTYSVYGLPWDATFEAFYVGFINGDNKDTVFEGSLTFTCSYQQYDDAGYYAITPGGLSLKADKDYYDLRFVDGTLDVGKCSLDTSELWWSNTTVTFNGEEQFPTATVNPENLKRSTDELIVLVEERDGKKTIDAGEYHIQTTGAFAGAAANNYYFYHKRSTVFKINKADALTISDVLLNKPYEATSITASVTNLMPDNAGTLTYTAGSATTTGNVTVSDFAVNENGTVTATISGGNEGDTITLPVTIGSKNYQDSTVNVVISLVNRISADVTITGDATKSYGDPAFEMIASATHTGDNDAWTWTSSNPSVATVSNTGEVTILGVGTTSITAAYESDTTIGSASLTLTVNPRRVTIPTAANGLKWTGGEQTGVANGRGYTVTGGTGIDIGGYTATATLDNTVNYVWSDNTTEPKIIAWSIGKANAAAAPANLVNVAPTTAAGNNGKITGVTEDMEYSTDLTNWTPCSGTEITGLAPGTYYVRIKETEMHEASTPATVVVPAYEAEKVTDDAKKETGSDSGNVNTNNVETDTVSDSSNVNVNSDQNNDQDKTGSQSAKQEIIDKKLKTTTLAKPKAGKKSITISWKKQTKGGIKGYEIQYSIDKKFKKDATKTISINKAKTTTKTIKKLKSKTKYYIRIRTFTKKKGEKVYSKWSKTKNVKVK